MVGRKVFDEEETPLIISISPVSMTTASKIVKTLLNAKLATVDTITTCVEKTPYGQPRPTVSAVSTTDDGTFPLSSS